MNVIQLTVLVMLKRDIEVIDVPEQLSKILNYCFTSSDKLKKIHKESNFKFYCISGLYPSIRTENYKANQIYSFQIRTLEPYIADMFSSQLIQSINDLFVVLNVDRINKIYSKTIKSLYTVTPTIVTKGREYKFYTNDDIPEIKGKIIKNTTRKYRQLMGINVDEYDFIEDVTVLNNAPLRYNYKNAQIVGNKFLIKIKDDRFSQQLAIMLLGAGVLEKNSLGFGFCTIGKR